MSGCRHSFQQGWLRRIDGTRAMTITPKGQHGFRELFGVRVDYCEAPGSKRTDVAAPASRQVTPVTDWSR
jgi:hypothetical protein